MRLIDADKHELYTTVIQAGSFSVDRLDKPAEPMVSVYKVRKMVELAAYESETDEEMYLRIMNMVDQIEKERNE